MKDNLVIFDTTLRDGEQSPGASMTKEEKVRMRTICAQSQPVSKSKPANTASVAFG